MKTYICATLLLLLLFSLPNNVLGQARLVKDVYKGAESSEAAFFSAVGPEIYFTARTDKTSYAFWRSDGTSRGTLKIKDNLKKGEGVFLNGIFYFYGWENCPTCIAYDLYRSDGTAEGTYNVLGPPPAVFDPSRPSVHTLTTMKGQLFFFGEDSVRGLELWRSDGTKAGTTPVTDVSFSSVVPLLLAVNGKLVFFADDGVHGDELWVSDGTRSGTYMVKDIRPGPEGNFSEWPERSDWPASANGLVFFGANDGRHGFEPWRSDGTVEGTFMIEDILPGRFSSEPSWFTDTGSEVFFEATVPGIGRRLFRSDGSKGSAATVGSSSMGNPVDLWWPVYTDGKVFFPVADYSQREMQLWLTDGTESGTFKIKTLKQDPLGRLPVWVTAAGSGIFFAFEDDLHGLELWQSNGTEAGTGMVADIWPGPEDSNPYNLTVVCGTLYFSARSPLYGLELWKYERNLPIRLDVFADGKDEWRVHSNSADGRLTITVGVDAGTKKGKQSDWWLRAFAPNGQQYWYDRQVGWALSQLPVRAYAGPLRNLTPRKVLNAKLPPGRWRFDFSVDARDGFVQWGTCDTVNVKVTP